MSIEDASVIDIVSLDKNGNVQLTISDHLEWDIDNKHLLLLQEKLNAYLSSIEGGDLYDKYPEAKGRKIILCVTTKFWPNEDGHKFLSRAKTVLEEAGYDFQHRYLVDKK
jgi:hypothetical protein